MTGPVKIYYRIGMVDRTDNVVTVYQSEEKTSPYITYGGTINIDTHINLSVPLSSLIPGHRYYLFFYCLIDGAKAWSGNTPTIAKMQIIDIQGNVYLTF